MALQKNVVVIIGGWADIEKCIEKLRTQLQQHYDETLYFRYNYAKQLTEGGNFESMEKLAVRLWTFLQDKAVLSPAIKLNLVGYSQGGMLVLYMLGKYLDLCKYINRIVLIAAPHNGALIEQAANLVYYIHSGIKDLFLNSKYFIGQIIGKLMQTSEDQLKIFGIGGPNRQFVEGSYPAIVQQVFQHIPKEKILEIYSISDNIARPESCRKYEQYMELFAVDHKDHSNIANNEDVIQKILDFLNL